jgi:D-glycerate 3-kinase
MDRQGFSDFLWTWICGQLARPSRGLGPAFVGLSAPQGAGKTAMTAGFCRRAAAEGRRAVGISFDDFYLRRTEQLALARRHAGNRFLAQRGYPGTHDIALGAAVLAGLKALAPGDAIALPAYDRAAFMGKGDRRPEEAWPRVEGPLDLVILEGWMLGFGAVEDGALADPQLREVNAYLGGYAAWTAMLDAAIWLEPADIRFAVNWRAEAEADARAAGRGGMSDAEVRAFAEGFLPAYATWLPTLRRTLAEAGPLLHVVIGHDRLPVGETWRLDQAEGRP